MKCTTVTLLKKDGLSTQHWVMVFNNISVISWWSVLLVMETGVPGENHRLFASH